MIIKKNDVVSLWNGLNNDRLNKTEKLKLAYAVVKNKQLLKSEIEAIEAINKPSDKFVEYVTKYRSLKTDEDRKLIDEEYKEELAIRKSVVEQIETILKEEINIDLLKIKLADLPSDMSAQSLQNLMLIVEE